MLSGQIQGLTTELQELRRRCSDLSAEAERHLARASQLHSELNDRVIAPFFASKDATRERYVPVSQNVSVSLRVAHSVGVGIPVGRVAEACLAYWRLRDMSFDDDVKCKNAVVRFLDSQELQINDYLAS